MGKGRDLDRHLYVTYKKSDTNRYRGLLANTYRENGRIIKRDPNQAVKFNNQYFNEIKRRGYDALIDDNDSGIWSREPTILLSPKGAVTVTNVRQLTAEEINSAQKNVLKYRGFK